jgi:hypothetical protein
MEIKIRKKYVSFVALIVIGLISQGFYIKPKPGYCEGLQKDLADIRQCLNRYKKGLETNNSDLIALSWVPPMNSVHRANGKLHDATSKFYNAAIEKWGEGLKEEGYLRQPINPLSFITAYEYSNM